MKSMLADENIYRYILEQTLREHPEQTALRAVTRSYPHAGMQISPEQGQFMALLIKLIKAERTIEIGVFTGYSALCVALALPEAGNCLPAILTKLLRKWVCRSGSGLEWHRRSTCASARASIRSKIA